MSMSIWICMLFIQTIVKGAPKLGHVMFDPLSYEATQFEQVKALLRDLVGTSTPGVDTTETQSTESTTILTEAVPTTKTKITSDDSIVNTSSRNGKQTLSIQLSDIYNLIEHRWGPQVRREAPPPLPSVKLLRRYDIQEAEQREPCAEYDYNGQKCRIVDDRLLCGYNKNKGDLKDDAHIDIGNGCHLHRDRIECGYKTPPFTVPRRPPARREERNANENIRSHEKSKMKLRSAFVILPKKNSEDRPTSAVSELHKPSQDKEINVSSEDEFLNNDDSESKLESLIPRVQVKVADALTDGITPCCQTLDTTTRLPSTTTTVTVTKPTPIVEKTINTVGEIKYSRQELGTKIIPNTITFKAATSMPLNISDSTPILVKSTKEKSTSTISIKSTSTMSDDTMSATMSNGTEKNISRVESTSAAAKVVRFLRSVTEEAIENPAPKILSAPSKAKPKRWCVEKGDRIVCVYAKHY